MKRVIFICLMLIIFISSIFCESAASPTQLKFNMVFEKQEKNRFGIYTSDSKKIVDTEAVDRISFPIVTSSTTPVSTKDNPVYLKWDLYPNGKTLNIDLELRSSSNDDVVDDFCLISIGDTGGNEIGLNYKAIVDGSVKIGGDIAATDISKRIGRDQRKATVVSVTSNDSGVAQLILEIAPPTSESGQEGFVSQEYTGYIVLTLSSVG